MCSMVLEQVSKVIKEYSPAIEVQAASKSMSTVCFDKVTSMWPHSDDGATNIPQLRSQVLDCY